MKVTKLGHCCLLIKEADLTILTDPGNFSDAQDTQTGIDAVLITHEHADHFHIASLEKVLANNPAAAVFTNTSVGKNLEAEGIPYTLIEDGGKVVVKGVLIEGVGKKHAVIYPSLPSVENTGFFIAERLFYPGDALSLLGREVQVLALPVAGPWVKTSEAVDYALAVKPKKCFPVHDGMLNRNGEAFHRVPKMFLEKAGIEYVQLKAGQTAEF